MRDQHRHRVWLMELWCQRPPIGIEKFAKERRKERIPLHDVLDQKPFFVVVAATEGILSTNAHCT